MAGRMGRRGRGEPVISISTEQSGLSKEEAAPVLQPSPSYPPLNRKPPPMELTPEMSYLVALKLHFAEYMQASPNYVQADKLNEDIERYCENYEKSMQGHKKFEFASISEHDVRWSMLPTELRPSSKRKLQRQRRKRKDIDMEKKFMELEKKEETQQIKTEEEKEEEDKEGEEEKDAEGKEIGERMKEEEEVDEEMDDGTDYANEYFETGENYFSEEDNDDGPIY